MMIVRKRKQTTSLLWISTAACVVLLMVITACQLYTSVHRVHEYSFRFKERHHEDQDEITALPHWSDGTFTNTINEDDKIIKRQAQAPRLRGDGQEAAESIIVMNLHKDIPHRRVVHLEPQISFEPHVRIVEAMSEQKQPKRDNSVIRPFERAFYRDCSEIADWQIRPTCNLLHELPNEDLKLISTRGSWRSVWGYDDVIVKRLRYDRDFDREAYVRHDTDALAMEKLSSCDFVCDIYASCGPSVVTERSTSSARQYLKNPNLSGFDRLELARDLATAMADLHGHSIMHNDLNMANILEVNGTLKLNDFNIGIRMRQFPNHTVCRVPVRFEAPLWKSPEEIRNTTYVDGYAADVYGLGNLLFQVLTKRQPWTHLEEPNPLNKTQVAAKKLAGGLPNLPNKYTEYSGASKILGQAVMACFRIERRPSAKTVANTLASAVRYFESHPNAYLKLPDNLFDS